METKNEKKVPESCIIYFTITYMYHNNEKKKKLLKKKWTFQYASIYT